MARSGRALGRARLYLRTHGEFLRVGVGTHVITRMTQGYDSHGSANVWMYLLQSPFYFIFVFGSMIGWSLWFPWGFTQLRAENWGANGRYLLSGILVTFLHFHIGLVAAVLIITFRSFRSLRCCSPACGVAPDVRSDARLDGHGAHSGGGRWNPGRNWL